MKWWRFDVDVQAETPHEAAAELSRLLLESDVDELVEDGWLEDVTEDHYDSENVCRECDNRFDDNPGQDICKTCEDWVVPTEVENESPETD
jgi:hypothetical protein